jgi:uncharacterized protein
LLAYFVANDENHARVSAAIQDDRGPLVVSPFVIAELDYLILARWGVAAELAAIAELTSSTWDLADFGTADLLAARGILDGYQDQEIGLTDASVVVLANRYRTDRVLTLDQRHFRILRTRTSAPFTILPN